MACTCLDDFDEKLKAHNTRLVRTFVIRPLCATFPKIAVEKINPRVREEVLAVPSFCPFCGVAYDHGDSLAEAADAPVQS